MTAGRGQAAVSHGTGERGLSAPAAVSHAAGDHFDLNRLRSAAPRAATACRVLAKVRCAEGERSASPQVELAMSAATVVDGADAERALRRVAAGPIGMVRTVHVVETGPTRLPRIRRTERGVILRRARNRRTPQREGVRLPCLVATRCLRCSGRDQGVVVLATARAKTASPLSIAAAKGSARASGRTSWVQTKRVCPAPCGKTCMQALLCSGVTLPPTIE